MIFPEIDLLPNESLEKTYDQVIAKFLERAINIYVPEQLNEIILCKDIAKIFNVYGENIKHTFFVTNTIWDDEKVRLVLNSFTQTSEKASVHFYSVYPLPDVLRFISKNTNEAFFELDCIRNFNFRLKEKKLFHNKIKELLTKHFSVELKTIPANDLKTIESLLIKFFRKCDDYEIIYDTDIEYFPYHSLVFIGAFIASIMEENLGGEIFYQDPSDIQTLGVGFSSKKDEVIDIMAHPIEKVFKFFFYGKEASIINWYYDIKYLLKTGK